MYAVTEFHLVSLYSVRNLHTNAFSARTLPCPPPASVKLALLAKLLERDGPSQAQPTIDWLAPLEVWWRPPATITVTTATVRIYKADAADKPLLPSKGMREYAHCGEPFTLAVGPVPDEQRNALAFALGQLRALGNAESLIQPLAPPAWHETPPAGSVNLSAEMPEHEAGVAVVLDDLGDAPAWERLNVYRVPDRRLIPRIGPDRMRRIVTLPFEVTRWTDTGYVLTRMT